MGSCYSTGDVQWQCYWSNHSRRADAKERLSLRIFIHVLCILGHLSAVYATSFQYIIPRSSVPLSSRISGTCGVVEDYPEYSQNVPRYVQARAHVDLARMVQPRYVFYILVEDGIFTTILFFFVLTLMINFF